MKETQKRSKIPKNKKHQHQRKEKKQDLEKRGPLDVSIGAKRILSKLRRMAKHIVKKMKKRAGSVPLG